MRKQGLASLRVALAAFAILLIGEYSVRAAAQNNLISRYEALQFTSENHQGIWVARHGFWVTDNRWHATKKWERASCGLCANVESEAGLIQVHIVRGTIVNTANEAEWSIERKLGQLVSPGFGFLSMSIGHSHIINGLDTFCSSCPDTISLNFKPVRSASIEVLSLVGKQDVPWDYEQAISWSLTHTYHCVVWRCVGIRNQQLGAYGNILSRRVPYVLDRHLDPKTNAEMVVRPEIERCYIGQHDPWALARHQSLLRDVGLSSGFTKAQYDTNRSESRKPQSDPSDPVNAIAGFEMPKPIRLLCGSVLFLSGVFLLRGGVRLSYGLVVIIGWLLAFFGGAFLIPCLPNL